MDFEEKVDVLLATYNSNIEYLRKQIDSILNQTYNNIHLIISDDNSQNIDVMELLRKYEITDKRVTIFKQQKNIGYIKNFEFLLTKSDGDYIAYADHDDIWYKDKIEKCVLTLKGKNVDLVYSDCRQIDKNDKVINESYLKAKHLPMIKNRSSILAYSRHIAIGCSTLFTKKIKDQMLPFTENVMAHDWLNVYLASKANGIAFIKEPLFDYRLHDNNEFGGRGLEQNLSMWKLRNGSDYSSYQKYRNDRVIKTAYLNGSLMCKEYRDKLNLEKNEDEDKIIDYYNKILDTVVINFDIKSYNKYLFFKGIGKRAIKEIVLFHFPLIGYMAYKIL